MEIKRAGSSLPAKGRRMVHRYGTHRSAFSGTRSGVCAECQRDLRAGSANSLAHAPLGQTLIVTPGCGRAQRWEGPVEGSGPEM